MKWLVSTVPSIDQTQIQHKLAQWDATLDNEMPPVKMDTGEQVFEVEGPPTLPELASHDESIVSVAPNAEIELFSRF
ncbi:MAG: hypothetical protein HY774_10985 [Acidobacteria bacterium]|nr:hypothetical protein [Acidobacteriota bacterium]